MEKVKKLGLKRNGRLLYVGKDGDVWQISPKKRIANANIKREEGYLYFVDKQGDVSRAKMKKK